MCQLRVKFAAAGEWITKADVGSPSEQPDAGDRLKAAFSDALKRAAVKFGIGRYLYRLPGQWVDYDPAKKQITRRPELPAFALPKAGRAATPDRPPAAPTAPPPPATPAAGPTSLPATGAELHRRLRDYDAKLASQKLCPVGALLAHVTQAGVKAGFAADVAGWSGPAIVFAVDAVKAFEQSVRPPAAARNGAKTS
jgi:hypothetical protein